MLQGSIIYAALKKIVLLSNTIHKNKLRMD